MSLDATAAFAACYGDYFGPQTVTGMALIAHARNAGLYVPVRGQEPELATDAPAWIVTFGGRLELPRGMGWTDDPVCVVVDGQPYFYIVGARGKGDTMTSPRPYLDPPKFALPSLAP
jgi:hypothetical protein